MKRLPFTLLFLIVLAAAVVLLAGPGAQASPDATITVTSTADPGDGTCDATECTLREAITAANANAGTDTIGFDIAGTGPHTISPDSALPTITDPVIIDGTSEPDFAGSPIIELDGSGAGASVDGLNITAGTSTIRGLVINRFTNQGIELSGSGGNTIEGNFIGTDLTGTADLGNSRSGVYISGAAGNMIGGTTDGARNVISGNDEEGVVISGGGTTGNMVQGNYIGTDKTGTAALGNFGRGVMISDAANNTIGGTTEAARNVISGNDRPGVGIYGSGATGNQVQGNYIGTDVTGTADLGNSYLGVDISDAPTNTIGGTAPGARNVISGNQGTGVQIANTDALGNQVQGNYIGTDKTGTATLGNSGTGVVIFYAANNTIGGTTEAARNVISGNDGLGVLIEGGGATENRVEGNYIGTDKNGTADLGNSGLGVRIRDGCSNTIGGTAAGARNIISGNDSHGIGIRGISATANQVQGNYIGTDVAGTTGLGNSWDGVRIQDGSSNTIGGTTAGAGNLISGNFAGVTVFGNSATGNQVQGNYIGTDVSGTADLGNLGNGVSIDIGATSNTIGGTASGQGNTIAYSGADGVNVNGSDATRNTISGNSIHSNNRYWVGRGIRLLDGGNMELAPPIIDSAGGGVSGHTDPKCYPCTVEVFSDNEDEGRIYHGSTTTNDDVTGTWLYPGAVTGPNVTATTTDASGNTSEFSAPVAYSPPVPVGGIAELPDVSESAGRNYVALGGLVAALVALGAGGRYARRRWPG